MHPPERVRDIAANAARAFGLELFDIALTRSRGSLVLQVVLDRPWTPDGPERNGDTRPADPGEERGVTLDDCAQVSQELGTVLDVEDVLPDSYTLEVSSPGLDRPLRQPDDYRRFVGRLAKIVLSEPVNRQTAFAGRLRGLEGDEVLFESEGGKPVRLPFRLISRARLEVEF